jgi:hypothetical protein
MSLHWLSNFTKMKPHGWNPCMIWPCPVFHPGFWPLLYSTSFLHDSHIGPGGSYPRHFALTAYSA